MENINYRVLVETMDDEEIRGALEYLGSILDNCKLPEITDYAQIFSGVHHTSNTLQIEEDLKARIIWIRGGI